MTYTIRGGAFDSKPERENGGSFGVLNEMGRSLTVGLMQGVTANGSEFPLTPTTAVRLPLGDVQIINDPHWITVFVRTVNVDEPLEVSELDGYSIDVGIEAHQTIHYLGLEKGFKPGPLPS